MKNSLILMLLASLALLFSCRQTKEVSTTEKYDTVVQRVVIKDTVRVDTMIVKSDTVHQLVTINQLQNLPQGAGFHSSKGRVELNVVKNKEGTIAITANCDSLYLLTLQHEITIDSLKMLVHSEQSNNEVLIHDYGSWINSFTKWFTIIVFSLLVLFVILWRLRLIKILK